MVPCESEAVARALVKRMAEEYSSIVAAPAEWLDEAYRGRRVVSDDGVVLFVNGKAFQNIVVEVQYLPFPGKGNCKIVCPEFHVPDNAQVELVTKVGGFVLFKGVVPKDVEVHDNPEPGKQAIVDKAQAALEKLGLTGGDDDF